MAETTLYELDRRGLSQDVVNAIVLQLLQVVAEGRQLPDDSSGVLVADDGNVRVVTPSQPRNYALQAPEVLRALLVEGCNPPQPAMEQGLYTLGLLAYEALTGQDYCLSHGIRLTDVGSNRYYDMGQLVAPVHPGSASPADIDPDLDPRTVRAEELGDVAIAEAVSLWTSFDPSSRARGTESFLAALSQTAGAQATESVRTIRISKAYRTGRSADQGQTVRLMVLGSEDAIETITIKTSYPSCALNVCREQGDDITLLGEHVVRKPQGYANPTYDLTVAYSAEEDRIYVQITDANGLGGQFIDLFAFDLADMGGAR